MMFISSNLICDPIEQFHHLMVITFRLRNAHGARDRRPGFCHFFKFSDSTRYFVRLL
jgi:hypothetical protein